MNADLLRRLAEAVADGTAPPWPVGEADPQIDSLRNLSLLAGAFRATTASSAEPAREVLFSWRHLDVLERIGKGGSGEVYRAYDPLLRRDVALKLIGGPLGDSHAHGLIAAEARRMARLRHPAILAIHGADELDGRLGIWSDLLGGRTLEALLEEQSKLASTAVLELAVPLCEALGAVHAKALTHGDFKPANIMIQEDGSPVLMDFGAAREALTEQVTTGSPLVMAPELFGQVRASPAADMYAFGAVLYRMLAGRYPVQAATLAELEARHAEGAAPDSGMLSRRWRALVGALLARNPDRRPDAHAVLRRLKRMRTARQRWLRRLAVAAIVGSLSLGLVIAALGYREAANQRDRAQTTTATLLDVLKSPRPSRSGRNLLALDLLKDMRPRVEALLPDQPWLRARVMLELADTFLYFDDFANVRKLGEGALAACAHCSGQQQAQLELRHHYQLAEASVVERHMQAAEDHARAALAIADRMYPHDSADYGYALARVGDALLARRKLKQAGPWLEQAMQIERTAVWQDAEKRAFVRGTWLTWLTVSSSLDKAEAWAREQVAWTEAMFGRRHSISLSAHMGLNRVLIETNQIDEADRRLRQDIKLAGDWLGGTDATTLALRLQHAAVLSEQGRADDAIRALEAIRNQVLASEHPDQKVLMVASGNLASRYKDAGRFDDAAAMYRWVIERATRTLGPTHARVLLNRVNLAELHLSRGKTSTALSESLDIEKTAREHLGEKHMLTLFAQLIVGRSQAALGRYPQALQSLDRARSGLAAKLGPDASLSLRADYRYANALASAGRRREARKITDGLKPRMVKALGSEHEYVADLQALRKRLQ